MKLEITYVDENTEDIDDCIEIKWLENSECYLINCVEKSFKLDVHSVRKIKVEE